MPALDFLRERHPVWTRYHEEWERREKLLRGGLDVIETELTRFAWESEDGDHFPARQRQAVYPEFGSQFLRTIVGHVLRERPEADRKLDFGNLGKIERDPGRAPTQAELVYYNVNGTGNDGQQWWQWVAGVFQRAGATGLRWVLVEAPRSERGAASRADEQRGMRPYAVEFSPRAVTNWRFERGTLQWCVIRLTEDTRAVVDGQMTGSATDEVLYLLVRKGVTELGPAHEDGGWWRFDADLRPMRGVNAGTWDHTDGEIPMALAVWEWEHAPSDSHPLPLARFATTALDNLSVAVMNTKSAWRSNAWRAAGSPDFLLGVQADQWDAARDQIAKGSAWVGVPGVEGMPTPSLQHGSAALVTASAFGALLSDMIADAERMMLQEATSTPDSSGRSKEAGFAEAVGPRLVILAENIEAFANTVIRFFEMRFGHARPKGYVEMPREFDLTPLEDDIRSFFDTLRRSELSSTTLESDAIVRLAEVKGLVNDRNRELIRGELQASAEARSVAGAQEDDFMRLLAQPLDGLEAEETPPAEDAA